VRCFVRLDGDMLNLRHIRKTPDDRKTHGFER
jgi:hypothetical protein